MNIDFISMSKKDFIQKSLLIVLGTLINAISFNLFIIPNKLLSGGISGIVLLLHYLFNIPVGLFIFIFNIPLLILSALKINKQFTILTILGSTSFSICLTLTEPLTRVLPITTSNELLFCVYGGMIGGVGLGIVFSNQGSTGGMDIISVIAKQKYNINIGIGSFISNLVVVAIGSIFFGIENGLYTLIVMYISSVFTDKVLKGFSKQKMLIIITKKQKEISSIIMSKFGRGITILYGEGAYSKEKRNVLYCIVSPRELPRIKHLVEETDANAFLSITDTSEVQGAGFKKLL